MQKFAQFQEELRPETVQVRSHLENGCAKLEQLRAEVLAMHFNSSSLLADLDRIQTELGSEEQLRQKVLSLGNELADQLAGMVLQYGEHINQSVS